MKIHHIDDYAELRRAEYPSEADQIHALMKVAAALKDNGLAIPEDAAATIGQVEAVKAKYPKE